MDLGSSFLGKPPGSLHLTVCRVLGEAGGTENQHGEEQGTSVSCIVPHGHCNFPKQEDRRAGAQDTTSMSVPAKPYGSALM